VKISAKRVVCGLVCLLAEAAFCSQDHLNPVDRQVEDLLSRMTLEEKVGQLNLIGGRVENLHENEARSGMLGAYVPPPGDVVQMHDALVRIKKIAAGESRLRIPPIIGFDLIHGAKTVFPIPLALAASFDPAVWTSMAQVTAREARAIGIDWTFAPMIDVGRDARWGRVAEGAGEDPFLTSCFAETLVLGYQGVHPGGPESIAACAKHFAAYGACEGGRDYDTAEVSKATLYNVYLPPFRAAVDAGALTVMNGFHDLDGVPMVMNQDLLRGVLKGKWGFPGFVVSDASAIPELIQHGVAASRAEAAALSLSAGTDMDLGGQCYRHELVRLVQKGTVSIQGLDDAVRRILRVKGILGLLSGEPAKAPSDWQHVLLSADHRSAAPLRFDCVHAKMGKPRRTAGFRFPRPAGYGSMGVGFS
jgi:beta-glucosidase